MDYAGIYMPTFRDLILQKPMRTKSHSTGNDNSKNAATDVDTTLYSLPTFVADCLRGDTTALDMLHCDNPLSTSWVFQELAANRTKFYSKNMKAYVGYVRNQAMKYGLKGDKLAELVSAMEYLDHHSDHSQKLSDVWQYLPQGEYLTKEPLGGINYWVVLGKKHAETNTCAHVLTQLQKVYEGYGHRAHQAMTNDGMDWKALSHALRVAYQVRAIFEHGDFRFPLEETAFIMRVKQGKANYGEEVAPELDKLLDYIAVMTEKSSLPEEPDTLYWDNWLMGVYSEWFNINWVQKPT
jgi:hypothetical protein